MNSGDKAAAPRVRPAGAILLLLCVCAAVRLTALGDDPPRWLSWSMGVDTDEGFYTLDARHEALFGHLAPGNFHDRLVSPLLSVLQQAVFTGAGVGTLQARAVSVVFGLLTLAALGWGLRQVYDRGTALWGVLLLGLAPPVVFYNRMALQETPAAFWLTLAFALWAAGRDKASRAAWLFLSGVALALALLVKAFAIIALPALLVAFVMRAGRGLLGLALTLAVYLLVWYWPHHAELARMGAYYRAHQFLPHSGRTVWLDIRRGFLDTQRGVFPCLVQLMPVPCLLAAVWAWQRCRVRHSGSPRIWGGGDIILALWLLGGLLFCLLSPYAPDRYYVLFYPALAGLAARGAVSLNRQAQLAALVLFLATSGYWIGRAWQERDDSRLRASHLLARTLPPGSVLAGEMAPALCLDTPFAAAPVQPGLSNDERPVERLGLTHIVVTRVPAQVAWWRSHYPNVVQSSHRVLTLSLQDRWRHEIDVYAVRR